LVKTKNKKGSGQLSALWHCRLAYWSAIITSFRGNAAALRLSIGAGRCAGANRSGGYHGDYWCRAYRCAR
jgi:hypothetical protein